MPGVGFAFCGSRSGGRTHFVAGVYRLRRLPLGGKLSPKVTDEGAILSQPFLVEGGTYRPDAFLLPPRWANRSPPHPPQCAHWGTFPPRGRLCAVRPFPSAKPPPPARPAGGRAVTGVRYRAAGQEKKEGEPPQGPPKLEKVGPGRKNLFLPGVLSSDFLQRKSGSPPESAGPRGAAPRGFETAPTTRRVRTTGDLAPGPTSGTARRRSNPAEKKKPPLWSATRGRIPRRRATLSSCFLYVCPGKAGRLALCGGRGLTPAPA